MPRYEVLAPVRHDGARYGTGAEVDLADAAARPLLAKGIVKPLPGEPGKQQGATETVAGGANGPAASGGATAAPEGSAGPLDRRTALVAAARGLDRDDKALWTQGGLPQVGALETASGLEGITAAERDAIWREAQGEQPVSK